MNTQMEIPQTDLTDFKEKSKTLVNIRYTNI